MSLRAQVHEIVEVRDTLPSKVFDYFITFLIVLNVVVIVLDTELEFRVRYEALFRHIEVFSVFVFTVEYLLRLWSIKEDPRYRRRYGRLRWALTPMALVDFFAVAPYYLVGLMTLDPLYLRVVRLIRLLKITRYSRSMDLLLTVLRKEANSLLSAIFILIMLILLAAAGIYLVEGDDQPVAFGSIPRAIWWATVTLTTVGYGDVVPHSAAGQAFAMVISIVGIGLAALPAGILASGFQRELDLRKRKYEVEAREALADGVITRAERRRLNRERQRLGLEREEAREILEELELELDVEGEYHCPHCGGVIHHRPAATQPTPDGKDHDR